MNRRNASTERSEAERGVAFNRGRGFAYLAIECALLLGAIVLCFWLGGLACDAWLARAAEIAATARPTEDEVRGLALRANSFFAGGVVLLAIGRTIGQLRGRDPLPIPLLVPATVFVCLLGLLVHHATLELVPRTDTLAPPSAASFAQGFLFGAIAAAAIMAAPFDLAALASRLRIPIALAMVAIFAALALFGTGPGTSGARINLGPIQPIEAVKPLFVVFLASYLGARASKLRWQRQRILGLRWPRLSLLFPAILALIGIFAGLYLVGDLGPVLILACVFLGMFYLVTRATGWVLVATSTLGTFFLLVATFPALVNVGRVATRIRMWRDPFGNGVPHGDQLGESLWSSAAGGFSGQGLANAHTPLVPAGKTDLVLATMTEQIGALGLLAYLVLFALIAGSGFFVAARNRTPERVLLAGGTALLLVAQWAVIHGGTFGLLPLTGVVVPFLSMGRSSMFAFVALVGILARLAEDGRPRTPSSELDELHAGARAVAIACSVLVLIGAVACIDVAVIERDELSASAIVTRLADGTIVDRQNPRLLAIAERIRRGTIADRNGAPLAHTVDGARRYPLGPGLGTLLGAHPSRLLLPPWALERTFDARLRGYGERREPRVAADLSAFVPLLRMSHEERAERVAAIDAAIASRSVTLSIDARLQQEVVRILRRRVQANRAAAAVVLDGTTGQVLARAQVPDYDPNDPSWQDEMLAGDRRFSGAYGAWPDKTGVQGMFQSGSVGKLFTSLAAARTGLSSFGGACDARTDIVFACVERDAQGPFFTRPGWTRPIHDHFRDRNHGRVDLVEALAVSCNVYFGQLALQLGPEPFRALRDAGAEVGYGGSQPFEPGAAGSRQLASTGFGQGALVMSTLQAARLAAAIGAGGHYRVCPPTMELSAPCSDIALLDDPNALAPILAGMRGVMTSGTGRSLEPPDGVRVYGKTGTADVRGFAGEEPFGIARASVAPPHSWFVALVEPRSASECAADGARIAVAVVFPRGGTGASRAGPAAMEIVAALDALGYLEQAR